MSLTNALADLYRRLNFQTAPAAAVTTRLTAFLNEAQQDIIGEVGGSRLMHGTITFPSVVNQSEYGLPPSIARVLSIRDTANQRRLTQVSESQYRATLPNTANMTGTPDSYALLGYGSMAIRPTTADKAYAVSSSAADTVPVLYYEAVRASGQVIQGSVTLNGVTAVQFDSLTDIVEISDIYLSAACVGTVSVTQTSGAGPVMSSIYPGDTSENYQRIALIKTPATVLTYTVEYELDAAALVNGTDEFPLPPRFLRCVAYGALMKEYFHLGDVGRYQLSSQGYERELKFLRHYLAAGPDTITVPGGTARAPSILPGNWPWDGYGVR